MDAVNHGHPLVGHSLAAALRGQGVDPLSVRPSSKLGPQRPLTRLLGNGPTGEVMIEIARDGEGRRRLLTEAEGRRWASGRGIAVPTVLGLGDAGAWFITAAARAVRPNPAFVESAMRLADRIGEQSAPPDLGELASDWRAPRRTRVLRGARTVVGGVPPRLFRQARGAFRDLPHDRVVHGDFYHRNIVENAESYQVVDWEFSGWGPRFSDHLRLWSVLPDKSLRHVVLDRILDGADRAERRSIGVIALWMSVRLLGENLSAPRRSRSAADLAHARAMLPEARELVFGLR